MKRLLILATLALSACAAPEPTEQPAPVPVQTAPATVPVQATPAPEPVSVQPFTVRPDGDTLLIFPTRDVWLRSVHRVTGRVSPGSPEVFRGAGAVVRLANDAEWRAEWRLALDPSWQVIR